MMMIAAGSIVIASMLIAVGQLVSNMHHIAGDLDPERPEAR